MKILPATTNPPSHRIRRRHSPTEAEGRYGYREYRDCLRREFGFTCAFCLVHESDLVPTGVEGLGVTAVEHHVPVSVDPEGVNDYQNCFYICRLCNGARRDLPTSGPVGRLLNPCSDDWGGHFTAAGDRLQPRPGDGDALYTYEAYDLDDARKVRMRKVRRETIEECLWTIRVGRRQITALLTHFNKTGDFVSLEAAEELWRNLLLAIRELARFRAVPKDAPASCRCSGGQHDMLPSWLDEQTAEV